jgi:hypothetical protein
MLLVGYVGRETMVLVTKVRRWDESNGHQGSGGLKWLDWVLEKRVMFPICFPWELAGLYVSKVLGLIEM